MADTKKVGFFKKTVSFFRACIGEIKKITWPTVSQTTKNFGIVVLVIVAAGLVIYGLDRLLYLALNLVMATGAH